MRGDSITFGLVDARRCSVASSLTQVTEPPTATSTWRGSNSPSVILTVTKRGGAGRVVEDDDEVSLPAQEAVAPVRPRTTTAASTGRIRRRRRGRAGRAVGVTRSEVEARQV